jgi:hypothetical protein
VPIALDFHRVSSPRVYSLVFLVELEG